MASRKKLSELIGVCYDTLNTYGKDKEQLQNSIKLFVMVLGEYTYQIIRKAFVSYLQEFSNFPTPADIIKIIKKILINEHQTRQLVFNEKYENDIKNQDWKDVRLKIRKQYGNEAFIAWINKLEFISDNDGQVVLRADSRFIAEWVTRNFVDDMFKYWKQKNSSITSMKIDY